VAAALSAYAAGQVAERAALETLSRARLLIPLVERAADGTGDCGHQGEKEMASPRLIGRDGRPAILAFTSLDAFVRWRPDARPVPAGAGEVWSTAAGDSCAVVIDVAGPVPLAVDGARLAALASGGPLPAPHADADVQAQVMEAVAGEPAILGAELAEGPDGTDLAVRLTFRSPGVPGGDQAAVRRAAEAIAGRLAGRLRRGIEITATSGPGMTR
jgi:hypothetical protein